MFYVCLQTATQWDLEENVPLSCWKYACYSNFKPFFGELIQVEGFPFGRKIGCQIIFQSVEAHFMWVKKANNDWQIQVWFYMHRYVFCWQNICESKVLWNLYVFLSSCGHIKVIMSLANLKLRKMGELYLNIWYQLFWSV